MRRIEGRRMNQASRRLMVRQMAAEARKEPCGERLVRCEREAPTEDWLKQRGPLIVNSFRCML